MSFSAQLVLDSMGHGKRLRVPHDRAQQPQMVDDPRFQTRPMIYVPVGWDTVAELRDTRLITKLTEFENCNRLGWRDMGFTDGHEADYWVCIQ